MMMTKLIKIEGIGESHLKKLNAVGLFSVEDFLESGASPKGRKQLVEKTGINDALILKWVNRADLFRIKGIGEEYGDLLEAAGVDTVPELAQRKADNLYQKIVEINTAKKLVRKLPAQSQIKNWVDQAKKLPRLLTY
jgi:predicted flap endonuclease-1-like 5' DNA nuclease